MERCDKCKYWNLYYKGPDDDFHPEDYEGECKRFPPTIYKDHGEYRQSYSENFMFPTTAASDYCGEFRVHRPPIMQDSGEVDFYDDEAISRHYAKAIIEGVTNSRTDRSE